MAKSKKIDKELGFRLKKARLDQKLTYDELSEKSGVSSRYIKEIENQEMPIVYIISNYFNKYKKIYAFIVLASIFTTAISVGIGFLQNISKNSNSYPQFVLFMCITSLLMSNIGFSKLLNFIYPVFGYIGILQIVIIFFIN